MFMRKTLLVRACALALGLQLAGATTLLAAPSDCPESATGEQTGHPYSLTGQSTVTETSTSSVSGGACTLSAGTEVTYEETYNVGTYKNDVTGDRVEVNCSNGQVIGRL